MDDLFNVPDDDALLVARNLDRIGDAERVAMRKGAGYRTFEHRGAKLLRWYVSHNSGTHVAQQAKKLISDANQARDEAFMATWLAEAKLKDAKYSLREITDRVAILEQVAVISTMMLLTIVGFNVWLFG